MNEDELRRKALAFLEEHPYDAADPRPFRAAQFDAGLAWVHFPVHAGGLGLAPVQQEIVTSIFDEHDIPVGLGDNPIGYGMAAPTIATWAGRDLRSKLLKPLFTCEHIWCQMFSEPSNGSDVAGVSTRAVRDGDTWVVNGQKVWTSLAHRARYGLLLARTDPSAPKHQGLSYFVVDMTSPGVEVRPLIQLTGDAEFNEVYFDDVRIPADNLLGREGDGWRVATTTLMNERVAIGSGTSRGPSLSEPLVQTWSYRRPLMEAAVRGAFRERVLRLVVEAEVVRTAGDRARDTAAAGTPGPEGSIVKLVSAELMQRIASLNLELLGADAMIHEVGYAMARSDDEDTPPWNSASKRYLRSRAFTIEGGTSEIMRNILAERILGLPGDVRVDKDVAWQDIAKS